VHYIPTMRDTENDYLKQMPKGFAVFLSESSFFFHSIVPASVGVVFFVTPVILVMAVSRMLCSRPVLGLGPQFLVGLRASDVFFLCFTRA